MMRRMLLLGLFVTAWPQASALTHYPQVALSAYGTATIDGVFSPGEWTGAARVSFLANLPAIEGGGTTPAVFYVMNDGTHLYMGVTIVRSTLGPVNSLAFSFDNDHDGQAPEHGDDTILANFGTGQPTEFFDDFRSEAPPCPPGVICGFFDTADGGTNDGSAAATSDGSVTVLEMSHPLDSADDLHDFSLGRGETVGVQLSLRLFGSSGPFADTTFPAYPFADIVVAPQILGNGDFHGDFDGDGRADVAIYRPSSGTWHIRQSSSLTPASIPWGGSLDVPVPGDYDGDGTTDVAVYRPSVGTWFIRQSTTFTPVVALWGDRLDTPVPADYDGDGTTDIAVFRRSTGVWYIRLSSTAGIKVVDWGGSTDVPVQGDYDGDGFADVAIFRPSTSEWFIRRSSTLTLQIVAWGGSGDTPVPADYDGDGSTDVAIFRLLTGQWFVRRSSTLTLDTITWGVSSDRRLPGDYDGDGLADVAVFRPSTGEWFIRQSGTRTMATVTWGSGSDIPILKRP